MNETLTQMKEKNHKLESMYLTFTTAFCWLKLGDLATRDFKRIVFLSSIGESFDAVITKTNESDIVKMDTFESIYRPQFS